jgi:hypothetical protein
LNIDAAFVLLIFISTIIGLLKFQKQPGKVFGFTFIALIISGQVSNEAVLASMSNKGLITLIAYTRQQSFILKLWQNMDQAF